MERLAVAQDGTEPVLSSFSLVFRSRGVEGEYLKQVSRSRWGVLTFIFCFDLACYFFRFVAKLVALSSSTGMDLFSAALTVGREVCPQLANMGLLYAAISLLNRRSRKHGDTAARQEELSLSVLMAMAICNLLASLGAGSPQDYVYAAFFLICTTTFLKLRWWVGTLVLAAPVVLLHMWQRSKTAHVALPSDALVHILVAWAVGGLMAYLAEWYRRQMFASQCMAAAAHQKELLEAQARMRAQRQLAAAQAQAAQRALAVARDKAAHDAQIEFMSLMCHEVRTPLNGCLASAEMILETQLCPEQRELANTIKVSGSILLSTVSNFLDFFKMEAGKTLDIVRTEVDLLQLVHDVHCIIEAMVGRNGNVRLLHPELTMSADSVGPDGIHHIICDPDRVRGILLNLYTNAAKFTKQGHIGLRVQEVKGQHEPDPGEGYGKVTVTPAYQPAARAGPGRQGQGRPSEAESAHELMLAAAAAAAQGEAALLPPAPSAAASDAPAGPSNSAAAAASSSKGASVTWSVSTGAAAGQDSPAAAPASAGHVSDSAGGSGPVSSESNVRADGEGSGAAAAGGRTPNDDENSRWLLFEVMDTGVGISQEGLHALFKEYCQGTEAEMRKPRSKGGTGLGLSICSKQVAVLGGRIGAYSSPDKGSVFWFTIPLILPPRQPPADEPHDLQPTDTAARSQPVTAAAPVPTARQAPWSASAPSSGPLAAQRDAGGIAAAVAGGGVGTLEPSGAPAQDSEHMSIILQSNPEASHQYAVSIAARSARRQALANGAGGGWGPAGAHGVGSASRSHRSMDMPPHFTMDTEQPSLNELMQRRMSHQHLAQLGASPDSSVLGSHGPGRGSLGRSIDAGHLRSAVPPGQYLLQAASDAPPLSAMALPAQGPGAPRGDIGAPSPASGDSVSLLSTDSLGSVLAQQSSGQGTYSGSFLAGKGSNDAGGPGPSSLAYSSVAGPQGAAAAAAVSPALAALRGRRVLLVEDNLINQTVARKMLAGLGMHCTVASNGLEAVTAVQAALQSGSLDSGFDVVLMDMMMPVMGGVDATRRIRELEAAHSSGTGPAAEPAGAATSTSDAASPAPAAGSTPAAAGGGDKGGVAAQAAAGSSAPEAAVDAAGVPRVPILAMTANASDRDREECRAAGMDGFLSKPVLKDRLAEAITQVLTGVAWQAPSSGRRE